MVLVLEGESSLLLSFSPSLLSLSLLGLKCALSSCRAPLHPTNARASDTHTRSNSKFRIED
jgi:hypothetical protein